MTFFFGASLALGRTLELLLNPTTELVMAGYHYKIHFGVHITIPLRNGLLFLHRMREDNASKGRYFLFILSAHEESTYQVFSPFQFVKNGMAGIEFFSNFSCSQSKNQLH